MTQESSSLLECQVCIVGTGIAGLALASQFSSTSFDVVMLESGEWNGDNGANNLNRTKDVGLSFRTPTVGQNRGFGGTTKLWGGQCARLDTFDFKPNPNLDDKGWPFPYSEMPTYYERALELFSLPKSGLDHATTQKFPLALAPFNPDNLRSTFSVFSPKRDLGRELQAKIKRSRNIRVVTDATVTKLLEKKTCSELESVQYRSTTGRTCYVKAKYFILACGPIEIPRLLLWSRDKQACGIGNQNGLVGRYLQDHLICSPAKIVSQDPRPLMSIFEIVRKRNIRYSQKLSVSDKIKVSKGALNASASVVFDYENEKIVEPLTRVYRSIKSLKPRAFDWHDLALLTKNPLAAIGYGAQNMGYNIPGLLQPKQVRLSCVTGQEPNKQSLIELDEEKDKYGVPLPKVDWKIEGNERTTIQSLVELCSQEFQRLKLGQIKVEPWLGDSTSDFSTRVQPILHPSGTTRMADSPTKGVVDVNGCVFGQPNLYVASSSVFPNAGHANTGLTIAAMAIRLFDHLKPKLRQKS